MGPFNPLTVSFWPSRGYRAKFDCFESDGAEDGCRQTHADRCFSVGRRCVFNFFCILSWFVNREKKMSRTSSLKVLDHAMIGPEGVDNCQKFVDILGLGRIFPLFIKTPKAHKKAGPNKRELEGN